jgi:hypothetical protein
VEISSQNAYPDSHEMVVSGSSPDDREAKGPVGGNVGVPDVTMGGLGGLVGPLDGGEVGRLEGGLVGRLVGGRWRTGRRRRRFLLQNKNKRRCRTKVGQSAVQVQLECLSKSSKDLSDKIVESDIAE